jgi:hypothetical protein
MRRTKEYPNPLVVAVPALEDGNPAAVIEREASNVDRIGETMLTQPSSLAPVDRSASIGA